MGDVWGIRLVLDVYEGAGIDKIRYDLVFSKRKKSSEPHLFLTSRAIHLAIRDFGPKLEGKPLGLVSFWIEKEPKRITSDYYYPLDKIYYPLEKLANSLMLEVGVGGKSRITGSRKAAEAAAKLKKTLSGLGIATLAELQMEKDLLRRYPGYRILSTQDATPKRIRQLRKRGRRESEPIPLEEAVRLTRKKVQEDRRKATENDRKALAEKHGWPGKKPLRHRK